MHIMSKPDLRSAGRLQARTADRAFVNRTHDLATENYVPAVTLGTFRSTVKIVLITLTL